VGDLWRQGDLRVVHEHLAAAGARTFLGALCEVPAPEGSPLLIATTLPGQMHEIGALMVAATAASEGWRALYAGPNLPAEEVALAVRSHEDCRVLALSFVFPPGDALLAAEVRRLGELLTDDIIILAGGHAAEDYADELESIGARRVQNLQEMRVVLEEIR
jgi:methanogenic corrinoid protein MtbC1